LGKPITALANFKIDPAISISTFKVVFLDEFFGDVEDLDADIFRIEHGRVEIEVLEVDGAEASIFPGEDTIEEELDKLKRGRVGANVTRIADSVATNGDSGAVRVILVRTDLTDNHGVTDFLALVGWDVIVVDDEEGIGTRYPLLGLGRSRHNTLAESTQLFGIRSIPRSFVTGVSTELAVLEELSGDWVKNRQG
jgi:hypothetical protein